MVKDRSTYIGRQQKNLLLIKPLSQIEAEKEKILKNESVDASNVDLTYTALNLLDHVMECSAFHPGCDPKELVEVGLSEVQKMVPSIDSKDARSIARPAIPGGLAAGRFFRGIADGQGGLWQSEGSITHIGEGNRWGQGHSCPRPAMLPRKCSSPAQRDAGTEGWN